MGRKVLGKVMATINGVNSLTITSSNETIKMEQNDGVLDMSIDPDTLVDLTQGHIPVNPESTEGINMWLELD